MKQQWKKQLHRKLLASTAVMVGASIALPVIGATTQQAMATPTSPPAKEVTTSVTEAGGTYTNTNGYGVYVHGNGNLTENDDLSITTGYSPGGAGGIPSQTALKIDGGSASVTLNADANITADASTIYSMGIDIENGASLEAKGANNTVTVKALGLDYAGIQLGGGSTFTSEGTVDITGAPGLIFTSGGGTATLNILNVTSNGDSSTGVYAKYGAQVTVNDLNITTTSGRDSYGVIASKTGTLVNIVNGEIHVNSLSPDNYVSAGASALRAKEHSEIDVTGDMTLSTSVVSGEVIRATGGSTIKLDNAGHTTSVTSNSDISDGVSVGRLIHPDETDSGTPGSTVISNGDLNITTNKATSFGIHMTGDGANLQTGANSQTEIQSTGTAIKFQTGDAQSVTLNHATITNSGQAGQYSISSSVTPTVTGPGTAELTTVHIDTTTPLPGNQEINDFSELHQAVNNQGNLFQIGGQDSYWNMDHANLAWTSGTTLDGTAYYNLEQDRVTNGTLSLVDSIATAGGGKLLMDVQSSDPNNGSSFTFNNDATELHGGVATQIGSTLDMGLTNNSAWYIDQNSNLTKLTNDKSSIIFDNTTAPGRTLTTQDYTAANNGSILFTSQLGDNSSPTDKLIINGAVTGETGVYVSNAGGSGGQTTGNGIQLIDASTTTATTDSSFTLQNPVYAGLYEYKLYHGGITANAATDNDFFLRSSYSNSATTTASAPAMSFQVVLSMLPNLQDIRPNVEYYYDENNDNSNNSDKNKQAQLPATAKIQNVSLRNDYGAPTLQDALYHPGSNAAQVQHVAFPEGSVNSASYRASARKGIWARLVGQDMKFQSNNAAATGFDGNIWGVQAGIDLYASVKNDGSRQYAGVYLANADASGDSLNNTGSVGSVDLDATSVGLYYTKTSPEGWYLNGVAQYSWIHNVKIQTPTGTANPDGSSAALSLEAGKQLNPEKNFILEPQVQLVYSHNTMDNVTIPGSPTIQVADLNAATGRIGLRMSQNPRTAKKFLPWISANIWHTFSSNSQISSGGTTLQTPIGGTVGELAAGFSTRPGSAGGWSFNASIGGDFSLAGAHYSGVKGSLGLRKSW